MFCLLFLNLYNFMLQIPRLQVSTRPLRIRKTPTEKIEVKPLQKQSDVYTHFGLRCRFWGSLTGDKLVDKITQ